VRRVKQQDGRGKGSAAYHHGNLREALVKAARAMIAERGVPKFGIAELARILGVSAAAPYRHFRDRDALLAEVARRGFEGLEAELALAAKAANANPVAALERCAQAHLAYAGRETAVYAAMFDQQLASSAHPKLLAARDAAFLVLRRVAEAACNLSSVPRRPPPHMVALHVWSLTHGMATLFLDKNGENAGRLPMSPKELLEAGVLVYLQSLDLPTES